MSLPILSRGTNAALLALMLACGGASSALAEQNSGALSTATVSPQFDWGDGQSAGSMRAPAGSRPGVLKGTVQQNRIYSTPAPINPPIAPFVPPAAPVTQAAQPVSVPVPAPVRPAPATPSANTSPPFGTGVPGSEYVGTPVKVTVHGAFGHAGEGDLNDPSVDKLFSMDMVAVKDTESSSRPFRSNFRKAIHESKNILNYVLDYRAFGPSSEAADLILEEHGQIKSPDAQAYYKQRELETRHMQAVNDVLQLGMGLPIRNTARGQRLVDNSLASLRALVGEKQTNEILTTLERQNKGLKFPKSLASQDLWDMKQREDKIKQMVQSATSTDPLLNHFRTDLHKYNTHSKLSMHAHGLAQSALSIASFSPTMVAPVAETAYFLLIMATGGPEQDKLMRELYISKQFDNRVKMINDKAHMAIDTYHMALLSENPLLLACTQAMVREMSGEETMREVFGGAEVAQGGAASHSPPASHFSAPGLGLYGPASRDTSKSANRESRAPI